MATEVVEDAAVGVVPEKLADDLAGQDDAVGQLRRGAPSAQVEAVVFHLGKHVIDEAENRYYVVGEGHGWLRAGALSCVQQHRGRSAPVCFSP